MSVLNPAYTIANARAFGAAVYELVITNWGNVSGTADTNSIVYPIAGQQALDSIYGVMISPSSLWDRCSLEFRVSVGASDKFIGREFTVTAAAPLVFPMPGAITVIPQRDEELVANGGGTTSHWGATYFKDDAIASTAFATIDTFGTHTVADEARLNLLLFLQPPGQAVTNRAAMLRNLLQTFSGAGPEAGPLIYNVSGRRRLRLTMGTTGAGTWTLRIALMATGPSATFMRETTVATSAGVVAGAVIPFDLTASLPADWLMIYATRTDPPGDAAFQVAIQAYD